MSPKGRPDDRTSHAPGITQIGSKDDRGVTGQNETGAPRAMRDAPAVGSGADSEFRLVFLVGLEDEVPDPVL